MKAILHLTFKKKWFDQIARGEKKEEYREYKTYWKRRLMEHYPLLIENVLVDYDEIHFRNGYRKDSPFMRVEFKGMDIGIWEKKKVFIIHIGEILEIRN